MFCEVWPVSSNLHPAHRPRCLRGFTLVELMVTLAVLAVLITLAVPSMGRLLADWRVNNTVNAFSGALSQARSEAIKRGRRVTLCVSADQTSCSAEGDWSSGWILFEDSNNNGAYDAGNDNLIATQGAALGLTSAVSDSGTSSRAFGFLPTGLLATGAATVTFLPANAGVKKREAEVNGLGRLSITQKSQS